MECLRNTVLLKQRWKIMHRVTDTESMPKNITGFRPYRSAAAPQTIEVRALPSINADPEECSFIRIIIQTYKHFPRPQNDSK